MISSVNIQMLPQPDGTSCGPTCLHAIYAFYGDNIPLKKVISEVKSLDEGGTLAVFLGCHALKRGYRAHIYTFNLELFDPTWFRTEDIDLADRLRRQAEYKTHPKLRFATQGYLEFLDLGGGILFQDLSREMLKKHLYKAIPVITGLSSTYLYNTTREYGPDCTEDDVRGEPQGHFVVMCGYDRREKRVLVADPYHPNPLSTDRIYHVGVNRLIHSILLGIVTYDANILVIER